jgi:CHAT domain-containing protein
VAYRNARQWAAAESDLQKALQILRDEEEAMLRSDKGQAEALWSAYFARFQDTYGLLVQQLVEQRRFDEAFSYIERARAFEPLYRILQLDHTPKAFRSVVADRRLQRIQMALPPDTFILEYHVSNDRTYTWIVWRDGREFVEQRASRNDIIRWTKALQQAADREDNEAFEAGLVAPYAALIEKPLSVIRQRKLPAGGGVPRLVIVPDRVMQGLPISALRGSTTGRYLVEDALVQMQGSALLYVFSLLRDQSLADDRSVFLVGDPAFNSTLPLALGMKRLEHADREVRTIRDLYGVQTELRTGTEATVPQLIELAQRHAIVHLAAHGLLNVRAPYQSVLLLAPSEKHSGALEAQELLGAVKLDGTRLVILSTCSSAGGAPVGPEGVAPLVRPIISAGVPAVVGTLWDVNDATAREVLVSFHRHFKAGRDAADALREAQLGLLRDDKKPKTLKRALTWAPYQVIGHATSPFGVVKQTKKEEPP